MYPSNRFIDKWQKICNKFWAKKKRVQGKIDTLSLQIYQLEKSNDDVTQGSALSHRQLKRINYGRFINDNNNCST